MINLSELNILELFSVEHNQTPEYVQYITAHVKQLLKTYPLMYVLYVPPSIFGGLEMVKWFEFQNFSAQNWHFKLTHYFFN